LASSLPDALTLLRAGLAAALMIAGHELSPPLRVVCITAAALTDGLDGYLARRAGTTSRYGAVLDLGADGLFFLACTVMFWRIGVWPGIVVLAILSAALPEIAAQVLLLARGRPGSPRRWWNRGLGGLSYVSVASVAAGLWPVFWGVLQAACAWIANVLDLAYAIRGATRRAPTGSRSGRDPRRP
jgi:phosphatidylglycerophosphate synthase